jgi:hypothetical protein
MEPIENLGVVAPRPGPGPNLGKALRIDLHDDDLPSWRTTEESCAKFGETAFNRLEPAKSEQRNRQARNEET